jgi:cardiolipin synthase
LNIPNLLSLSRIILIPVFLYLLFIPAIWARIGALAVFLLASLTDLLDGWSARKLNQVSEFGKFLDPLADKILVLATLLALVILDPLVPLWMAMVIVGRDMLITLMRYFAIKRGASLRTSRFGKIKTAFQMISIVIIITILIFRSEVVKLGDKDIIDVMVLDSSYPEKWLIVAPYWIMFVVTLLTAISGIRYFFTNWRLFLPDKFLEKKRADGDD